MLSMSTLNAATRLLPDLARITAPIPCKTSSPSPSASSTPSWSASWATPKWPPSHRQRARVPADLHRVRCPDRRGHPHQPVLGQKRSGQHQPRHRRGRHLGVGIAVVLAAVLFFWPVQIMDLLSNKHELSLLGAPYLRLIGISYIFNMLSSIYQRPAQRGKPHLRHEAVRLLHRHQHRHELPADLRQDGPPHAGRAGRGHRHAVRAGGICRVPSLRPAEQDASPSGGGPSSVRAGRCCRRFIKYSSPVMLKRPRGAWATAC